MVTVAIHGVVEFFNELVAMSNTLCYCRDAFSRDRMKERAFELQLQSTGALDVFGYAASLFRH